jgi:hypothetical protein
MHDVLYRERCAMSFVRGDELMVLREVWLGAKQVGPELVLL